MFLFNLTSNCNLCRQAPYILTSFLTCAETETAIDVEAESAGEATDDEVPEAESARDAAAGEADDEVLGPQMVPVGIFQMPSVGLGGVVEGISRLIDRIDQDKTSASGGEATDGVQQEATRPGADDGSVERISERGTASGGDTPDGAQQETTHSGADDGSGNDAREPPPLLRLARDTQPCNDYEGGPDSIYMAWWPLMPLRRAFTAGQKIPRERWRHLYLYFDNRFANDLALLFHSASVLMRLAVNSAVSARVKSSAKSFKEDWEKLMKDQAPGLPRSPGTCGRSSRAQGGARTHAAHQRHLVVRRAQHPVEQCRALRRDDEVHGPDSLAGKVVNRFGFGQSVTVS